MTNTITKIEVQKNNKKRVNVYIDEDYAFSCDAEIVYKHDLKKAKVIDLEIMKEIISSDNFMKAKNDALRYIERSYKTEKEIGDKLFKKGYDSETIGKTLGFLKEYSFLDDSKYAEMYIKDKQQSVGKNKIKYDLLKKGIDDDIVLELTSNIDGTVEDNSAEVLARKKYKTIAMRENDRRKVYEKLLRFLIGKGFSFDTAKSAIGRVLDFQIEE